MVMVTVETLLRLRAILLPKEWHSYSLLQELLRSKKGSSRD